LLKEIEKNLEKANFRVTGAVTGSEGLSLIKKKKFDAIVLDVSLSDMDGWKICEEIKKPGDLSSIPLIILYLATERDKQEFHRLELEYTLDRPDDFSKLVEILRKLFPEKETLEKHEIALMIVEDDKVILDIVSSLFNLEGYKVYSALNPYRALDILKEVNFKVDLIVSDLMMPKMDGITFFLKLQENNQTKNIPFIMLTSRDQFEDIKAAYDIGIKDYLSKPFDPMDLLRKVEEILTIKQKRYYRGYESDV